jgi:hypothetical protein
MRGIHLQLLGQQLAESPSIVGGMSSSFHRIGHKGIILPNRFEIFPPITPQRPPRQRFAGIPLALAEVN